MYALSLTQPWATLVALGAKTYETMSWGCGYRGPLLIHASKHFPKFCKELAQTKVFQNILNCPNDEFPLGVIIARVNLIGIEHTEDMWNLTPEERAFGDYGPGRFAWALRDVERFTPVPCRGMLGLWTVPPSIAARCI